MPPQSSVGSSEGRRGRKPASESRAAEIRAKLLAWRQMPEPQRISLRALGHELGTSHQLLGHYLKGWEKWQSKEYRRQAREISAHAEAETRPWIAAEMQRQAQALEKAAFQSMVGSLLDDTLRKLRRNARGRQFSRGEIKMLSLLASRGYREAQKILDRASSTEIAEDNLPQTVNGQAKSFRIASGRVATPLKWSRVRSREKLAYSQNRKQ
jgi:hypothetical protein